MTSVIAMLCGIFLCLKLTKLFCIWELDSGKVLIKIIYYFYNYMIFIDLSKNIYFFAAANRSNVLLDFSCR